ncbi:MAG TPA: DUF4136 domain-containing protein [Cyclobacteriaceae bacterium]|nr:DUF4136 domain-containing protein [Cyclobacteriaceae bacterium]
MIRFAFALLFSLIFAEGTSQSVKVKTVKKTDFTQFNTFTVVKGEFAVPRDERKMTDEQLYEKMKLFVKTELELKGYKFTEDTLADFSVDYVVGSFNVSENEKLGPLGQRPATDPAMVDQSRYWSNSYRGGMLVLEIYRGKKDNTLWTAESSIDLSGVNTERALAAIISKSFKKFPAKKKGR